MIHLDLVNQSQYSMPRKFLRFWVAQVEKELKKRKVKIHKSLSLTVVFMDTKPAKELNAQFRRKNYATDVLSFSSLESDSLGELVICPQVIERQSKEHGLKFREECAYMVLHGILHLLGYDHEKNKKQAKIMFDLQDAVFEALFD